VADAVVLAEELAVEAEAVPVVVSVLPVAVALPVVALPVAVAVVSAVVVVVVDVVVAVTKSLSQASKRARERDARISCFITFIFHFHIQLAIKTRWVQFVLVSLFFKKENNKTSKIKIFMRCRVSVRSK